MAFTEQNKNGLVYMTSSLISAPHAFTTRYGGVSEGIFSSLNLGVDRGDDPENVRENYRRILGALGRGIESAVLSKQVHRDDVRRVTAADCGYGLFKARDYEADGLMTEEKEPTLVIFMADCVPILMEDARTGAVAAVHAGWRGTVINIVGKAVSEMARAFGSAPGDIRAAIGPCISKCCFQVGQDVRDGVLSLGPEFSEFLVDDVPGKWRADLKGVNRRLLTDAGLPSENIDLCPDCTACLSEKYWSHRVTRGERGAQSAIIAVR